MNEYFDIRIFYSHCTMFELLNQTHTRQSQLSHSIWHWKYLFAYSTHTWILIVNRKIIKIAIYESFFVHYALGLIATSLRTSFVLLLGLWSAGPFWSVFYYYFTVSFSSLFLGGIKSHSKGNKIIHTGVEICYNIAKYLFVLIQNWFLNRFCNFNRLRNSQ